MIVVPGYGPRPSPVLLVGEAPGAQEAKEGRPFIGRSGAEQDAYLARHGLSTRRWRLANVIPEYRDRNPDPTPELIAKWTPALLEEVRLTKPRLIVAVGRFSARWFLGDEAEMEACHGIPRHAGAYDPARKNRAGGAPVIATYHPAFGLREPEFKVVIAWDYQQVAETLERINAGQDAGVVEDTLAGSEVYEDMTGRELAVRLLKKYPKPKVLALDTEGDAQNPWSIQVSDTPGWAAVLRRSRRDFETGLSAIRSLADSGTLIVLHNAMHDMEVCRAMGLELKDARLWDTMYAAYLLRVEPTEAKDEKKGKRKDKQGLKHLAPRWTGMRMQKYKEVVGRAARGRQLDYLFRASRTEWPKCGPRVEMKNDGTIKVTRPWHINKYIENIIVDAYGKDADPGERWEGIEKELRADVEKALGPMPQATLDDAPLAEAVRYAARDADAALRLYRRLGPELKRRDLESEHYTLMSDGMAILPVFEEMQATGLPASRRHFEKLSDDMTEQMDRLRAKLSHRFFDGQPINPSSPLQVRTLMRRRGLSGTKRTSTGAVSTGKQSVEHLRFTDEAMALVFDWKERQHVRDSFCKPVLGRIPEGVDVAPIRCTLKMTRTATRRLASTDPNLLAIPVRTEIGRRVREGYRVDPDSDLILASWDHSQIEARVLAHVSADPLLCRLFNEGRDVHSETAALMFGIPLSKVDKFEHRLPAKTILFGTVYGQQAQGLKTTLWKEGQTQWTEDRCVEFLREFLKLYKGVKRYIDETTARVKKDKLALVRDLGGMPRYLPAIYGDDRKLAAEAGRQAVNHTIQGTAQTMLQKAVIWMKPKVRRMQLEGKDVRWSLSVHDEIIMWFIARLWSELNRLAMEALTKHCGIELRVPIEAEGKKGLSWAELK